MLIIAENGAVNTDKPFSLNPPKEKIPFLSEDTLLMCQECRRRSGDGLSITVFYTSIPRPLGGWSPAWEGRVCSHVRRAEIIEHFGSTALYQAAALRML
jgi:hypothetical protein